MFSHIHSVPVHKVLFVLIGWILLYLKSTIVWESNLHLQTIIKCINIFHKLLCVWLQEKSTKLEQTRWSKLMKVHLVGKKYNRGRIIKTSGL